MQEPRVGLRWGGALLVALAVAGTLVAAQGRRGGRFGYTVPLATPDSFDEMREPRHLVVRPTDPALFQCPFVMATEVGSASTRSRWMVTRSASMCWCTP